MPTVTTTLDADTKEAPKPAPRGFVRLFRAATSSIIATVISQVMLLVILWWGGSAPLASMMAFVAGAVPNYVLTRRWVWGQRGKPRVGAEVVPYLLVITLGGLAAVGLTTLTGHLLTPLKLPHPLWIVLLDAAYMSSYALVFVIKFTLLDRVVFGRGEARTRATTSQS
jgi:putative flippase GtrA